jgi:hypothetical protein
VRPGLQGLRAFSELKVGDDMGFFSKLFGGRAQGERVGNDVATCDVCNGTTRWSEGYVLSTKEVAGSQTYWEFAFTHQWSSTHKLDSTGDTVGILATQQAGQPDGWLVCGSCSHQFQFDRARAGQFARTRNSRPPGCGPCSVELVALAAAKAWQRLYGAWPASIEVRR